MKLVKKFDDGSFCVAYEVGDRVPLGRDIPLYSLHGHLYHTMTVGTMVTVKGIRHTNRNKPCWYTCRIRFECDEGYDRTHLVGDTFDESGIDPDSLEVWSDDS